jgi:chitinase
MTNINKVWLTVVFTIMLSGCKKSSANVETTASNINSNSQFRIVGYLQTLNISDGSAASFDFSKINYLNIAFFNPDQNGNFSALTGLNAIVTSAHAKNVKVLASIGGGSAPAYYSTLLSESMRADFINKIMGLLSDGQLDGIDVDLEGERIDGNYEAFITELSARLKQSGKLLTAAIATAYKSQYSDKALSLMDFINVMSYDKTGPWNPANPGQHSPYDMAVSDLDYWTNSRGIPKVKLSLGVPFYGYGFGTNAPSSISFGDIVTQYPGAENTDEVTVNGGGVIYYNGLPTIKSKTSLALKKAGGIMIWQLMQDASGGNSLLNAINVTIHPASN